METLGLSDIPVMLVLNKCDLVEKDIWPNLARRYGALTLSAKKREGLGSLLEEVKKRLNKGKEPERRTQNAEHS